MDEQNEGGYKWGNLRKDDDGHWYLIPLGKIEEWDRIRREMDKFDIFDEARWEFEDELDKKFGVYRLGCSIYDLKVLMEGEPQ